MTPRERALQLCRDDAPGWEERLRAAIEEDLLEDYRLRNEPHGILTTPEFENLPWAKPTDGWQSMTARSLEENWLTGIALYMQALRAAGLSAPAFEYEESPQQDAVYRIRLTDG